MNLGNIVDSKPYQIGMGLFLIAAGLAEGWDQLTHLGTHHGLMLIGLHHLLGTFKELQSNVQEIKNKGSKA